MVTWVVRGGSSRGIYEKEFLKSGTIGIYFGADLDLTNAGDDAIRRSIHQFYVLDMERRGISFPPFTVRRTVTYFFNQVLLFRDGVCPGDTIIMPRKATGGRMVAVGRIEGNYEHWEDESYQHRRKVGWPKESVPKEQTGYTWYASDQRTVFKVGE